MIPLRDSIRTRRFAVVTWLLITVNTLVFAFEARLGSDLKSFVGTFGLVPDALSHLRQLAPHQAGLALVSLLTSLFLHGGFLHLAGNMYFLYIFGRAVEDRLDHGPYLALYIVSGLAAGLCHTAMNPLSPLPAIGASGAISGVLGAHLLLYPAARILTLVPVLFIPTIWSMPAYFFILLWFGTQLFGGIITLEELRSSTAGIAWWGHVGGFIAGAVLSILLKGHGRWQHDDEAATY